jgi:formiminoglutamase
MVKDKLNEILNFFEPVLISSLDDSLHFDNPFSMGTSIAINKETAPLKPNDKFELALIGVCDFVSPSSCPSFESANLVRSQIYQLSPVAPKLRIADLGNLKQGKDQYDSLFALQEVCALLFEKKVHVIIIGGSQLYTIGQLRSFRDFENDLNLAIVDSKFDMGPKEPICDKNNFIGELIEKEAANIYNISLIGYQSYFVDHKKTDIFDKNHFDYHRLGEIRSKIEEMEPVLRDADLVSFDISSIRSCDAPGQENPSPNGLYAEEACALARYAGISDRNRSFAVYGFEPQHDNRNQTAKCIAQIIWYHIEGFHQRKHDYPIAKIENYTKYSVAIDEIDFPIVFYKSENSQRWWLEVANLEKSEEKNTKILVASTENDYKKACRNEIPERWWTNFKKLR